VDVIEIGAGDFASLGFAQVGADVEVTHAGGTIVIENATLADIEDAGNFLF
jgi:hypothetical protein